MTLEALRAFIEAKVGAPLERSAFLYDAKAGLLRHTGEVAGVPVQNAAPMDVPTARTLLRTIVPDAPPSFDFVSLAVLWNERTATATIYADGQRTTHRKKL